MPASRCKANEYVVQAANKFANVRCATTEDCGADEYESKPHVSKISIVGFWLGKVVKMLPPHQHLVTIKFMLTCAIPV